jgi:hypothetical protein
MIQHGVALTQVTDVFFSIRIGIFPPTMPSALLLKVVRRLLRRIAAHDFFCVTMLRRISVLDPLRLEHLFLNVMSI